MVRSGVMTERVLEAWVGKYVSVTLHTPRATGEHLTGEHLTGEHLTGRIQAVGNDGFIIQPMASPGWRGELGKERFIPWHAVNAIIFGTD
jgi:hypothetical protein